MSYDTPGNPFPFLEPSQEPSSDEPIGWLDDEYQIFAIYRGGISEVLICESVKQPGIRLALKSFQPQLRFERDIRLAFAHEVVLWFRLSGLPHIMPVIGLHRADNRLFVVMLAVPPHPVFGVSLRGHLLNGPLTSTEAYWVLSQMAAGLFIAQTYRPGLVHGDLKCENLLLWHDQVFLSDFGLARAADNLTPIEQNNLEGTWAYRAPELWNERATPSIASDVYAFGVIGYECLTGHHPFAAQTRAEWNNVHCNNPVPDISMPESDNLTDALSRLIQRCLAKNPQDRLPHFEAVYEALEQIGQAHAPEQLERLMYRTERLTELHTAFQQLFRDPMLRSMIDCGYPELALQELEVTPLTHFNSSLWITAGTILSLNNKDKEALSCYDKVLQLKDLAPDELLRCRSEQALSYKRVERYAEAIKVYEEIIPTAPEQMLPMLVNNLATVYYANHQSPKVIHLLRRFVLDHPGITHAWGNLALAYEDLGQYEEAMDAYVKAIKLDINQPDLQVRLGALYMDHFFDPARAITPFMQALGQGYDKPEGFERLIACFLLTQRLDDAKGLLMALTSGAGPDISDRVFKRASQLAEQFIEAWKEAHSQNPEASIRSDLKDPITPDQIEPHNSTSIQVSADQSLTEDVSWTGELQEESHEISSVTQDVTDTDRQEKQRFQMPHMQIRMTAGREDVTVDFYHYLFDEYYISRFLEGLQQLDRGALLYGSKMTLRKAPLVFTVCPGCKKAILTNRHPGKPIRCQICTIVHPVTPAIDPQLATILDECHKSLGWHVIVSKGKVILLVILTQPDLEVETVRGICSDHGFMESSPEALDVGHLLMNSAQRGLFKLTDRFLAFRKHLTDNTSILMEETPPDIEAVLAELGNTIGPLRSLSMTYDPEENVAAQVLQGKLDPVEAEARRNLMEHPTDINALLLLIEVLVLRHNQHPRIDLSEAIQLAERATQQDPANAKAWEALGKVRERQKNYEAAAQAFEQALRYNPISLLALRHIYIVYMQLGETEQAQHVRYRLESLGGFLPTA